MLRVKHLRNQQRRSRGYGKRNRALTILSAIANGSLKISAIFLAASAPWPRYKEIRRWQYDVLRWDPNIDFEKLLRDERKRASNARVISEVRKRRWVKLVKRRDRLVLVITKEGKRRLFTYNLDTLVIPKQKRWDGRWRIVLFDIPENERFARDVLRDRLKTLGFLQLQQSAFVFPYPCDDQLDAVIQRCRVERYVTFFTTDSLGYQEVKALTHFGLRRPK